jgi:hypothetical protein
MRQTRGHPSALLATSLVAPESPHYSFHNAPQPYLVYMFLPDHTVRSTIPFMLAPVRGIDVLAVRSVLMTHIPTDSSGPPPLSARWYAPPCVAAMQCKKWPLTKALAARFWPGGNGVASVQRVIHLLSPKHLSHDFRTFR